MPDPEIETEEQELPVQDEDSGEKLSDSEQEKIVEESKKRLTQCQEAEQDLRDKALDDLKFRAGEQWDSEVKRRREARKKPCLVTNVLPAREHQITNEYRQNRSWIQVDPVDDSGTRETADVLQGIVRHIEYDSDVDDAQDTALISSVRGGFGFFRLLTEFESFMSFQQVIKVDRIRNPFQVYLDSSANRLDRSDAKYGHIYETLTKEEYKQEYPDSELASMPDGGAPGAHDPDWLSKDSARICEYFRIEEKSETLLLVRFPNGQVAPILEKDLLRLPLKESEIKKLREGRLGERETKVPSVHWYKHNAVEVLEHRPWLGRWIPIIPVLGDELYVDGKLILEGMIRHAKDPIRVYNGMSSAQVEAIWLAPKAPWIADARSIARYAKQWDTSNTENWAYLPYDSTNPDNIQQPLPKPEREALEPPIQAITAAKMQAADDIRQVTGIHEAQLGQPSNEKSGLAIRARKVQGEISNFHFLDNMSRARKFLGRQLIDLIPKVYSVPMQIRIVGEDGAQKVVRVNQRFSENGGPEKIYDLTAGRYDVTISNQPSWATRRQEKAETLINLVGQMPQVGQVAPDLVVAAMDFPDSEKLAQRLKKTLPPGIADDDVTDSDPKAQLAETQRQLQAVAQQHQMLTQALNQANQTIQQKKVEQNAKVEMVRVQEMSRQEIVKMQEATKLAVAQINASKDAREGFANREIQQYQMLHDAAHDVALQADEHAHAQDMQAAQAQQQAQQQQAEQANQPDQGQGGDQGANPVGPSVQQ